MGRTRLLRSVQTRHCPSRSRSPFLASAVARGTLGSAERPLPRQRRALRYRPRAPTHFALSSAMSGVHQYTALLHPVSSVVRDMDVSHIVVMTRRKFSASSSTLVSLGVVETCQFQAATIAISRSRSSSFSLIFDLGGGRARPLLGGPRPSPPP